MTIEKVSLHASIKLYTGQLDRYFDFSLGELEFRSVKFENKIYDTDNFQGNAVVNYTEYEIPYTRVIEHKHFEPGTQLDNIKQPKTVVSYEYSQPWKQGLEPYYPINDEKNDSLAQKYKELCQKENVIFGGRLGDYKYYDMDAIIKKALETAEKLYSIFCYMGNNCFSCFIIDILLLIC